MVGQRTLPRSTASDERGDDDLSEDFLRLRPHPPSLPFLSIFIIERTAPGPVRTLIGDLRRPPSQHARQDSRAASGPAVVPRVDSNSISPTQHGGERTLLYRVLHAARLSVIGNKFRNKLPVTPATHRGKVQRTRVR